MIDLKDLMDTKFKANISHLEDKYHVMEFHCAFEDYECSFNLNTGQLICLVDNLQHLSNILKKYIADCCPD